MLSEHQHNTATEHALDDVIDGVTIAFRVFRSDDCYRASLALASIPNNQLNCYTTLVASSSCCHTVTRHVFIESLA